jgi:hypothetical protein
MICLLNQLITTISPQLLVLMMGLKVLSQPVLEHLPAAQATLALAPAAQVVSKDQRVVGGRQGAALLWRRLLLFDPAAAQRSDRPSMAAIVAGRGGRSLTASG